MNKNRLLFVSVTLVILIPSRSNEIINPNLETPRPLNKNELKGFQLGYKEGYGEGYGEGYEEGVSVNIIAYFQCAIQIHKLYFEVCDLPESKMLWENAIVRETEFRLPDYIEKMLQNDDWIYIYDQKETERGNGAGKSANHLYLAEKRRYAALQLQAGIPFALVTKKKPKNVFSTTTASLEHLKRKVLKRIKQWTNNWFNILICETDCPEYVYRLQDALEYLLVTYPEEYANVTDITVRFAANTARTYQMLCSAQFAFMNDLMNYAKRNPGAMFEDALFGCAPSWNVTIEQVYFLNLLTEAVEPWDYTPVKYYAAPNQKNQETLIIYDDTDKCPRSKLRLKPQTISTFSKFYFTIFTTPSMVIRSGSKQEEKSQSPQE